MNRCTIGFLILAMASLWSGETWAIEADLYCQTGTSSTGFPIFQPASAANPCPVTGGGGGGGGAVTVADGADVTQGAKADAKSAATDTTPITIMSVLKQVSASVQAAAASLAGTLTVGTHAVTQSGTWTVQPGNTANTTPWLVTVAPAAASPTSVSGTITAGGTAQQLVTASATRRGVMIMNLSSDPLCYSEFTVTPVCGAAGTYTLNPATATTAGGSYSTPAGYPQTNAIYIISATTGNKFTAATY